MEYIHLLPAGGAVRAAFRGVEMLFLFSGGLTAAYMVIKGVKRDIARCMTALRQLEQKDAQ